MSEKTKYLLHFTPRWHYRIIKLQKLFMSKVYANFAVLQIPASVSNISFDNGQATQICTSEVGATRSPTNHSKTKCTSSAIDHENINTHKLQ